MKRKDNWSCMWAAPRGDSQKTMSLLFIAAYVSSGIFISLKFIFQVRNSTLISSKKSHPVPANCHRRFFSQNFESEKLESKKPLRPMFCGIFSRSVSHVSAISQRQPKTFSHRPVDYVPRYTLLILVQPPTRSFKLI